MTNTTAPATVTLTCDCGVCPGPITAPEGYITGTPKTIRTEVHNYSFMVRNPVMGRVMAGRGVQAAD